MIILAIIIVFLVVIYLYGTRTFKYLEQRGIKHDRPLPLVGNNLQNYLLKQSVTQQADQIYWKYPKEKVVGFYRSTQPVILVRDPEIAKRILTTDFNYFYPRGLNKPKSPIEPMLKNLFFADGDLWRLLRQRMTPAFTSGKLKAMFPLICERAESLQEILDEATSKRPQALDARELMARYTTDFIGAVGFGLTADSLNDENSAFRKLGKKIFQVDIPLFILAVLKEVFPEPMKHVRLMKKVEKELIDLVNEIQRQRKYEPSGRNDFIDLLMECRKKGAIVGESIEKAKPDGTPETATLELTDELIAAQVFVFFAAGFETSSSATSYTLFELAFNPKVQLKVQVEIDRVLDKHDGKLSYDAVKEMTYLEWTFQEGMRKFPSLGILVRECAKEYTIAELGVKIDPGVGVVIPIQALHNDPQYFDNPEEFRPERFHPDVYDHAKNKFIYMPFGEGPRACIGARLGLMQSLAGLAAVLSKFSVEPAPETPAKPVVDPKVDIVQTLLGGLPLLFKKRSVSGRALLSTRFCRQFMTAKLLPASFY